MTHTIIEHGWVLTLDEHDRVLPDADVLIRDDTIEAVGPEPGGSQRETALLGQLP